MPRQCLSFVTITQCAIQSLFNNNLDFNKRTSNKLFHLPDKDGWNELES